MSTTLVVGDKAPAFKSIDQNGQPISLADYKGKKLALFFYPKDNTPTCTKQACNLSENWQSLQDAGIEVVGISVDGEKSHKSFAQKFNLSYPLVVDENKSIVEAYGVWGEKKMYGRAYMGTHRVTFLINEKGKIDHIIDKVEAAKHAAQILKLWQV